MTEVLFLHSWACPLMVQHSPMSSCPYRCVNLHVMVMGKKLPFPTFQSVKGLEVVQRLPLPHEMQGVGHCWVQVDSAEGPMH